MLTFTEKFALVAVAWCGRRCGCLGPVVFPQTDFHAEMHHRYT